MVQLMMLSIGGLRIGAVYALAAIGLVVIHKATRVVNFSHGALIMVGGYGAFVLLQQFGLPYWAVYLIVPTTVGTLAALAEFTLLRRMRDVDDFSAVIITVFVGTALVEGMRVVYESDVQAVPAVITGAPLVVGPVVLTLETLWIGGGALACALIALYVFNYSGLGRAMRAMASNRRGAQLCGYGVDQVTARAWLLGAGLAGLAGVFAAPRLGVSPEMAAATLIPAFVAAIIGGFNSLHGALLGGLLLGLLETYAAAYVSASFKHAVVFLVLLGVLLLKPEGLFPDRKVRNV